MKRLITSSNNSKQCYICEELFHYPEDEGDVVLVEGNVKYDWKGKPKEAFVCWDCQDKIKVCDGCYQVLREDDGEDCRDEDFDGWLCWECIENGKDEYEAHKRHISVGEYLYGKPY